MSESVICLAAFFLLVWVLYLKQKIAELQRNQKKLLVLLKQQVKTQTGDVEVTTVLRGWGKKAYAEEEDTSWVMKRDPSTPKPKWG